MELHNRVFGPVSLSAVLLATAVGGVEVFLTLLELPLLVQSTGISRMDVFQTFAFDPLDFRFRLEMATLFSDSLSLIGSSPFTLVSYVFFHANLTSAVFSTVLILCIGSLLSRLAGNWLCLLTFFISAIVGGLAYSLLPNSSVFLVGSSPGILGMFGLLAGLLLIAHGRGVAGASPAMIALPFLLVGLTIVSDVIFGPAGYWAANATGFTVGLILANLVVRGGLHATRAGLSRLFRN